MIALLCAAWAVDGTVTVPLEVFESRTPEHQASSTPVVHSGRAVWTGEVDAETGALALEGELVVALAGDGWKAVPLLGATAVLRSVSVDGTPVPVGVEGTHHTWKTNATGTFVVRVQGWAAPSGQRGSLEYDVAIPTTPSTHVDLTLPGADLRPDLGDAVRSTVTSVGGKTLLSADLKPTSRLHVLGLRDLQSDDARTAELYAETSHLVSVDDHRVEVFSVVRFSILYASAQEFSVFIPEGYTVTGASGEGAFAYEVVETAAGRLLQGRTRHPVRNRYELSLRLQRELSAGAVELVLPGARGVQREQGWVGLEVPGRMRVTDRVATGMHGLQIQQLPAEVRDASVSPLLEAWRLDGDARLRFTSTPLPEVEVSADRIDKLSARTVLAAGGRQVTELAVVLQNRSRHGLQLDLPPGTTVTSAARDGVAVVPAASDGGVVLPLRRTQSGAPQTLSVVLSAETAPPGWFGTSEFALPTLDLPVAAVDWSIHLPEGTSWSELDADVRSQEKVGAGKWMADRARVNPVGAGGASTVPVPEAGTVREYHRYWVDRDAQLVVRVGHRAPWLVALWLPVLGGFGVLAALFGWRATRRDPPVEAAATESG